MFLSLIFLKLWENSTLMQDHTSQSFIWFLFSFHMHALLAHFLKSQTSLYEIKRERIHQKFLNGNPLKMPNNFSQWVFFYSTAYCCLGTYTDFKSNFRLCQYKWHFLTACPWKLVYFILKVRFLRRFVCERAYSFNTQLK